jgi:NCAIR mutase (PurE)-related protein
MRPDDLKRLLERVASGEIEVPDAMRRLRSLPFEDLGFARVDHHRQLRRGFPEVVYAEGKTAAQCAAIVKRLAKAGNPVLVTRASREQHRAVAKVCRGAVWHELARVITLGRAPAPASKASAPRRSGAPRAREEVLVVTAGTSDIPVAEEAALTAEVFGVRVGRLFDVGVAGLHRLVGERERMEEAKVIVVVAGMEGALPSVVAGMIGTPVIGVPTSVGYGASLGGLTPLFGMLTSCSGGLTVVNIDNGFGAGLAAALLAARMR